MTARQVLEHAAEAADARRQAEGPPDAGTAAIAARWTPELVKERLRQAASLVERLPAGEGDRLELGIGLADGAPRLACARGATQEVSGPAAIARVHEALIWTASLDPIDRRIVWLRAFGVRWKSICWTVGLQRSAAHQHCRYGLCRIALTLNGAGCVTNVSMKCVIERARERPRRDSGAADILV